MAKIFYLDRPGTVIGDGISKEEFEGMTVDQLREAVIRGGCSIFRRHDGSYDIADDRSDTRYDHRLWQEAIDPDADLLPLP